MLIKEIPKNERPRERFLTNGPDKMTNQELLAIILRTGSRGYSVQDIINSIYKNIDEFDDIKDLTLSELIKIKGLKESKAIMLLSAIELGKRIFNNKNICYLTKINSTKDVYEYFKPLLYNKQQEEFYAIYLDNKKQLITYKLLFIGTINQSIVHPREIFKEAVKNSASSIIILHNHPSGNVTPSNEDIELTKCLIASGNMLKIPIIDHIIIGKSNYYSFLENNQT